jgi:hypothetical protein
LPVTLTLRERDIIRDETFVDPDFAELAVVDGKRVKVELSLNDIEEIQGYMADVANHTKNKNSKKNSITFSINFMSFWIHTMIKMN